LTRGTQSVLAARSRNRLSEGNLPLCRQFQVGRTGIEPVTLGLKVPCSTN
jgi:hypothetical protein